MRAPTMERAQIFFSRSSEGTEGLWDEKEQCSGRADSETRIEFFIVIPEAVRAHRYKLKGT